MIQCSCGLVNTIHSDFVQHVDKMRAWGDDSHMRRVDEVVRVDYKNLFNLNIFHLTKFGLDALLVLFYDRTWMLYYPARQSTGVIHSCTDHLFDFACCVKGFETQGTI